MKRSSYYAGIACGLLLIAGSSSSIYAQEQSKDHSAIVAVTDSLPWPNSLAAVVRSPAGARDLVVMRRGMATTTTLDAALLLLDKRRRINPTPEGLEVTALNSVAVGHGVRPAPLDLFLADILNQLSKAPTSQIANIGLGQSISISNTHH